MYILIFRVICWKQNSVWTVWSRIVIWLFYLLIVLRRNLGPLWTRSNLTYLWPAFWFHSMYNLHPSVTTFCLRVFDGLNLPSLWIPLKLRSGDVNIRHFNGVADPFPLLSSNRVDNRVVIHAPAEGLVRYGVGKRKRRYLLINDWSICSFLVDAFHILQPYKTTDISRYMA